MYISAAMKTVLFVVLGSLALAQGVDKKRISRLKCEEYSELVNNTGCASETYPFVGAIGYDDEEEEDKIKWACSATLISPQFVVTTAHCTVTRINGYAKYVRFGETDFSVPNSNAETYTISERIRHPEYKPPIFYNDIALLKLDRPVQFTRYIRPACLYTGQDLAQYNVAGFSFRTSDHAYRKGLLLHQNNPVLSNKECSEIFEKSRRLRDGVNFEKQLCAKDGSISCEINSGAPLLHQDEELPCMQNIAGIVALGKGFCGNGNTLNVKISVFADWIESVVWP